MEEKRKTAGLRLGVALTLLSAVVLSAGDIEKMDTTDLTSSTREMMTFITKISSSDSLPVFWSFYDTLMRPLRGVKCVLETRGSKTERISGSNGEVLFWIPRNQRNKVKVLAYSDQPLKKSINLTFSGTAKSEHFGLGGLFAVMREAKNAPIITGYGFPEVKDGKIRVQYYEGHKDDADITLAALVQAESVIDSAIGVELIPLKVLQIADPDYKLVAGGSWALEAYDSNGVYHSMPHEWVEGSLKTLYGVYDSAHARWIGDGLANYAANEVGKRYYPKGYSNLHEEGFPGFDSLKVYDLGKWKNPEFRKPEGGGDVGFSGYILAPYFWAKIVEKSGNPQLIPQFLEALRASKNKSSDTAIAILARLSGLGIAAELVIPGSEFRANVGRYWPESDTIK